MGFIKYHLAPTARAGRIRRMRARNRGGFVLAHNSAQQMSLQLRFSKVTGRQASDVLTFSSTRHLCPSFFRAAPVSCTACVHFKTSWGGLREVLDKTTEVISQSRPTCNRQAGGRFLKMVFHVAELRWNTTVYTNGNPKARPRASLNADLNKWDPLELYCNCNWTENTKKSTKLLFELQVWCSF